MRIQNGPLWMSFSVPPRSHDDRRAGIWCVDKPHALCPARLRVHSEVGDKQRHRQSTEWAAATASSRGSVLGEAVDRSSPSIDLHNAAIIGAAPQAAGGSSARSRRGALREFVAVESRREKLRRGGVSDCHTTPPPRTAKGRGPRSRGAKRGTSGCRRESSGTDRCQRWRGALKGGGG